MRSNIPLWKYTTAAPAPLFGVQNVSVEYLRSLSGAKYIFVRRSVFFGYELKLLISTAGGRFPRAWLEPPCASHYGVSRLMLFPQESPPSVPINWPAHRILLRRGINLPSKWNMRDSWGR